MTNNNNTAVPAAAPLFLDTHVVSWTDADLQKNQELYDKLSRALREKLQTLVDEACGTGHFGILEAAAHLEDQLQRLEDPTDDLRNLLEKSDWELHDLRHLAFDMRNQAEFLADIIRNATELQILIWKYNGTPIPTDADDMTDADRISIGI